MKRDVLILCQYFYPEYVSSATLPTELAVDLVDKGLLVDVVCGAPKEYYDGPKIPLKEGYKSINIKRVKYTEFNNKKKFGRILNFFSFFISVLFQLPRMFKYKVILVYSNPPILPLIPYFISKITQTKFIFVAFDVYPDNALVLGAIRKGSLIEKIMKFINKRVYTSASGIIALGNEMKNYMIKRNISSKPERIHVIPNWYSKDKLIGNDIKNPEFKKLKQDRPFIVLYSGNMGTAQDMDTILQCIVKMKSNDKVLFILCGHGNKVDYVKDFIESNSLNNINVYGFLLGEDYADVLKIADLCLVSLTKGIEGIGVPSKTYGYLAAGKPVIAIMSSDTDIAKNLHTFGAGSNIKQGDSKGLEKLILNYSSNKELLIESSNNARYLYESFYTRRICTEMYFNAIKNVIEKKEATGGIKNV